MFSKDTAKTAKDKVPSIISEGTHIVGNITTEGEVQIDGKVEGDLRCDSLVVADTGEVTGNVTSESVTIHGVLNGTVHGKSVRLSSTARIVGDVTHETLTIEPGAHFKGQCLPVETKKDSVVVLSDARTNAPVPLKAKEAANA